MGRIRELAERFWRGDSDSRDRWRATGMSEEIAPGVFFLHAFGNVTEIRIDAGLVLVDTGNFAARVKTFAVLRNFDSSPLFAAKLPEATIGRDAVRRRRRAMPNVLTVVARIYPKAGHEADVEALLVKMAAAVRKAEPDCLVYRPHRAAKEPVVFLFYEQYRSAEAFDFHRTAPPLAAFRERMKPLLAKPTEVEIYRSLTD